MRLASRLRGIPKNTSKPRILRRILPISSAKSNPGGDIVITQLFYTNDHFFRFVDRVRAANITAPIVPGLMPILSAGQIQRIASLCGAEIPAALQAQLNRATEDDAVQVGIDQCIAQATELLGQGAPGIHFYVLNRSTHMRPIIKALPRFETLRLRVQSVMFDKA